MGLIANRSFWGAIRNSPRGHTGSQLLLGRELGMGGGGRVDHQAAHIADVRHMAMELKGFHKRPARLHSPLDFKCQGIGGMPLDAQRQGF